MGSSRRERGVNEKMLFYEEKVAKMTSKMVIFPKEITLLMSHFLRKNSTFYNFSLLETWVDFFEGLVLGGSLHTLLASFLVLCLEPFSCLGSIPFSLWILKTVWGAHLGSIPIILFLLNILSLALSLFFYSFTVSLIHV